MTSADEPALRRQIVDVMQAMSAGGLNRGTSGNVSARLGDGMLVTPSGIVAAALTPESIVHLGVNDNASAGTMRPSSEWRMHRRLLDRRPDVGAVVHCHSRYATILACAGRPIPAIHYMIAVSGRREIPLAPYATFGSAELADGVVTAVGDGMACLMANHGLIALGPTLGLALAIAEEIEEQAAVYCGTLAIGGPKLLADTQMDEVIEAFRSYGQKQSRP